MAWPKALKSYFSTLRIIIISPYYILLFEFWFGYDCTYHSDDCNRSYWLLVEVDGTPFFVYNEYKFRGRGVITYELRLHLKI